MENQQWVKVSTSNFQIITDLREKKATRIASDLEKFRRMYQLVFSKVVLGPARPIKIIAPKKSATFELFVSGNQQLIESNGFFVANNYGNYATIEANRFTGGKRKHRNTNPSVIDGRRILGDQRSLNRLFHEYTHYLVANHSKRNLPFWYSEGFAEYLSTAKVQKSGLVIYGQPIEYHLHFINRAPWTPIEVVLKAERAATDTQHLKYRVYAQGWLMVHYFWADPERSSQLEEFVNMISNGKPVDEAMNIALERTYEQLDSELRRYAKRGKLYYQKVETMASSKKGENPNADLSVSALDTSDTLFEFGEFFLYGLTRPRLAETFFSRSVELNPENVSSLAGLAKTYFQSNKPKAQMYIDQALAYSESNVWANLVAGNLQTLYMEEVAPDETTLDPIRHRAMQYLDRALALDPGNVAALSSKASLYLKEANFERARKLFERAYEYAPTSNQARFDLIVSSYAVGNFEEGDKIAEIVRHNHHASDQEIDSFNSWAEEQKTNAKTYFEQQSAQNN